MRAWLLAIPLLLPGNAYAQSDAFVVRVGNDTVAVETFSLSASRLEGELTTRGAVARLTYSGDVVERQIRVLQTAAFTGSDTVPAQTAVLRFQRDSVIVEVSVRGNISTQRFGVPPGTMPLINLAFSFVELALRTVRADTASIPFFLVTGGQTLTATVRRPAADSVMLTLASVELFLEIDDVGRIVRGAVPVQNVTIERVAGARAGLSMPAPDYSAPPGARYTAENVTIPTTEGHSLAGTLTLPARRSGRVPVVVTISGSGLQDRDEALPTVPGYRPFRQIAEALAARGVGVLRYDDRGFGASTGQLATATTADFADDTRAALAYLRGRPDVAPAKLFLLGHSEGAIIAPAVAATDSTVRGIVLLGGPSRPGRRILEYQNRYLIDQREDLTATQRDSLYQVALAKLDSAAATQPWLRYFLDYDPRIAARAVTQPVLIVHGATDRQVTADQAEELAAAFRAGRNRDVTVRVVPGVNHLLLPDPRGDPSGYAALQQRTMVASVMDLIGAWIVEHAK